MPQVTPQHIPVLTAGCVALLVGALIGIAALNHFANK